MRPVMLRRSGDFRRVLRVGRRLPGRRVVLYVAAGEQGVRVGFVLGRAVGGAVARNGVRRRLKEAWRVVGRHAREGDDIVIVARPEARGAKTQELADEFLGLLERTANR